MKGGIRHQGNQSTKLQLWRLDLTLDRVRVGIAGFGTVGRATAEIISAHADLIAQRSGVRLEVIAVRPGSGVRTEDLPAGTRVFLTDWNQLLASSDVDVTVETMGSTEESSL